jgi:hypothetical protein
MSLDEHQFPTGSIVILCQMLPQHPSAERGVIPGDLLVLGSGLKRRPRLDVFQFHAQSPRSLLSTLSGGYPTPIILT